MSSAIKITAGIASNMIGAAAAFRAYQPLALYPADDASAYNGVRTHLALDKDSPLHRPAQTLERIASVTWLGGLHRHYVRMA
jgi:hypothetical protein